MLWFRLPTVIILAVLVLLPVGVVVYQSFLDEPFFAPAARLRLSSYQFILAEPEFARAFLTSLALAAGMTAIAVPFGGVLAFLVVRTDLPGKSCIEPALLVPVVLSPIVIAFGYVIAVGPVGFLVARRQAADRLRAMESLLAREPDRHRGAHARAARLSVFLVALRKLNLELEEQARVMGAPPWRVALTVSLPLIWPALVYSGVLIFFLGFELFGLPLIIGDPANVLVLTTYLFKLTNILGTPSYQLMAVVVVAIALVTLPLVYLQRHLLRMAERYVTMGGKGVQSRPLRLGPWRWVALACIVLWLLVTFGLPLSGVLLRAFVTRWGEGINPFETLTLQNFSDLAEHPNLIGAIVNTFLLATVGGGRVGRGLCAASRSRPIAGEAASSRWSTISCCCRGRCPASSPASRSSGCSCSCPISGCCASSLVGLWLAYSTVWLAFGLRLISASLSQISPELEEAARVTGAPPGRALRDVTLPLIRFGLVSSWLLCFMIFVREYSTGVYLQGPGTEVLGPVIVSLFGGGSLDLVAALSVVNVALVAVGLALALRLGVRI